MRGDGLTMGGVKVKLEISILPPIRAASCAGGPPERNQTLNIAVSGSEERTGRGPKTTTITISRDGSANLFLSSKKSFIVAIWLIFGYVTLRRVPLGRR